MLIIVWCDGIFVTLRKKIKMIKNKTLLFVLLLLLSFGSFGQKGKKLTAYLQTKQFMAPEIGNYVELHFQYVGYTIAYQKSGEDLIGELGVFIDIMQHGKKVTGDAYRLSTPLMKEGIVEDFYDIKRFALQPGVYQCNIELIDMNSKNQPIKTNFDFEVDEYTDALSISEILVAESASKTTEQTAFSKSGYDILPRIATFYPQELVTLPIYFEVYNSSQLGDSIFSIRQELVNVNTAQNLSDFTKTTVHKVAPVVPVFKAIDLTDLTSGKYKLSMTVVDEKNNALSTQFYEFERSNELEKELTVADIVLDPAFQKSISDDSVRYYLASMIPISSPGQTRTILKTLKLKDNDRARKMIQAIWKETDPVNTYEAWMRYKAQVQYVQRTFKTNFQPGFETDRGRVYLQYGAPSRVIEREVSASEYPYEMWEYNKIGIYSNKKFIFYNPDLVQNTYRLLHSDMIGELNNPRWQYDLNSRNTKRGNVDDPNEYNPDSWGNNARQILR